MKGKKEGKGGNEGREGGKEGRDGGGKEGRKGRMPLRELRLFLEDGEALYPIVITERSLIGV